MKSAFLVKQKISVSSLFYYYLFAITFKNLFLQGQEFQDSLILL